jgi:hypothetical protein
MSFEIPLLKKVEIGKAYVIIMSSGKEFNMVVESAVDGVAFGKVARNCVMELKKNGELVADTIQNFEHADLASRELLGVEHCVLASQQGLTIKLTNVDVIEQPWRKFVPSEVACVSEGGDFVVVKSQEEVLNAFPRLATLKQQVGFIKPPALPPTASGPILMPGDKPVIQFPKRDPTNFVPEQ